MASLMCSILFTSLEVNATAPLYGFDENGEMAIVGEIEETGNEVIYDEVSQDGLSVDDGTVSDVAETQVETEILQETMEETSVYSIDDTASVSYAATTFALNSDFDPDSCLQYQVSAAGYSGILMIPTSYKESIYVDSDGIMWNVGDSSVVGRLFLSRSVSTGDYEQYIVTVRSCLTNSASNVYTNGSLSSVQHYYVSSSRIISDTYYGDVIVEDEMSNFANDDSFKTNLYLLIIIFILLGGGIICFSKHSRN